MIRSHYLNIIFAIIAVVIVGLGLSSTNFTKPGKVVSKVDSSSSATAKYQPLNSHIGPELSSEISFQEYVPPPLRRTYNYCVRLKNVDEAYRDNFSAKVAETLADYRGWSLDGRIKFLTALTDCNFTVWLSATQDMPTFSSVCSTYFSCAIGSNVIINFERWDTGSPSWSGNLDDYRALVINHETGHWLGFGHAVCGGTGQPAPVMLQQSIFLQGCTPNPWPLLWERQLLASRYGITLKN